jgi:hypothetical protein
MPIDFPNNPTSGQTYSYGINRWIYNGVAWDKLDNHPGICGGNQISINYAEGLNGATFTVNVIEGQGSGLDADLLDGVSGERFIENLETGLLYGGILSINSGNTATFDITSGLAIFTTLNATTTSAPAPTVSYTQWTAKTGVTLAGLTSTDITFVSLNSSGQFLQSNTPFTNTQYETQVPIGALVHPSRTYISFAQSYPHVAYDQASQSDIFIRSFGPLKISGHDISGYGATLQLSRASGVAYALGRNYSNDPNSPNLVSDTNANPASTIYRQYRGVTAGTWNTVVNTAVDPHYYDDGSGTLASIPGGRYSIQRVFYFPNAPTVLLVYYGRATYNSIDTAKAALVFEQFSESADTAESAIFCGYLIIKSGITNFSATSDYSIIQGGLFRSTVNVGGGGVAVANLDDLNDVTITSVANNQALVYDSSTGHWVNKSFTTLPLVSSFNGLTGAVTGVGSFNGATGTVVGVNSVRGLTGAVGITNGSGIGLSVSGQTMTFSNTGVLSIDGGTGAITNVARTNITNTFSANQTISRANAAFTIQDTSSLNEINLLSEFNQIYFYNDLSGGEVYFQPTIPTASTITVTLPSSNTTLAGLATTQTFTGTNTFSSLTNFSGGISTAGATFSSLARFNAGISAAGATFGGNIVLQNSEFIRNTTDGRIDFMPAPAGSTHYGLYIDTTSWGFGPRFGTIRSSDGALNTANILWDAPLSIGSNTRFNLTSDSSHAFLVTATGNDTLQLGIRINSAIYSGALALVDDSALGAANRSPGVTHANPNLYIYRAGSARATDFIRFEHDGNTGYMISGGTSDIELMPGSGIVGVSGNIQVLQNQIYVTNNARSWFL